MLLWIVALLPIETVVTNSLCVDGKDNVFRIYDTSKGKGKILLKNVEIGTYDKNKNPICVGGKPQFTLPGHFKLIKGTLEVVEAVKDGAQPLQLSFTLEKNSWLVGVVCEKGKSKNQFVPDEMCTFDLCKMSSFCYLLETKTKTPIDITKFVEKEYIDVGAMSIPQLSGEWQVSVDLIQGKSVLGGFRIGKDNEWLTLESIEGEEEEIDTTKSDLERHREL